MAAVVSQVPSVNQQKQSSTASNSTSTFLASSENAVRRPTINEHEGLANVNGAAGNLGFAGQNENVEEYRFEVVNVVSSFKTHCHIDLRTLARTGANVEFRRDPPSVIMKIRKPMITASVWSAGKVTCIGAKSEEDARIGARRVARKIQKCGFQARFVEFKIINCLAVAYLPFGVRIDRLKDAYPREFQYEPELHPAAGWKMPEVGGQLQVFQTGNLTITAPSVANARRTLMGVYHKLSEFRKPKDMALERNSLSGPSTTGRKTKRRRTAGVDDTIREDLKKLKFESIEGYYEEEEDDEDDE